MTKEHKPVALLVPSTDDLEIPYKYTLFLDQTHVGIDVELDEHENIMLTKKLVQTLYDYYFGENR